MKLRTKFLLSLLLLTTGLTGASLFIVRRSVRLHAREELSQELENSAAALRDFQARRERAAERSVKLLADLPLLKAMMPTRDPATGSTCCTSPSLPTPWRNGSAKSWTRSRRQHPA